MSDITLSVTNTNVKKKKYWTCRWPES